MTPDGLPARENHPVGAACLALHASRGPAAARFDFRILERAVADEDSDLAILEAIVAARPDVLAITLYVWNVVRSAHIVREAKRLLPGLFVVAGGPEVFGQRAELFEWGIDAAVEGEGEIAFEGLLERFPDGLASAPGLLLPPERPGGAPRSTGRAAPLASLDALGSPYLAGWIDAAHDRFLYLETTRGCKFHCTFCRYDADMGGPLKTLSLPRVEEVLRHAAAKGVREVFLLDPTLNQRRDTRDLLRALARGNPDLAGGGKTFRYGGELVGELIDPEIADLLAAAGFHTVEVGLQSTHPETLRLVERFHHRERFLRGVRLLKERGIRVRVDLIVGLPAETLSSMKAAVDFVAAEGIGEDVQVFELMVLPGTALAGQARALGIEHLTRPPYTVIRTPTLSEDDVLAAVAYSEERLRVSWNPRPSLRRFRAGERIEVDAGGAWRKRLDSYRRGYLALDARRVPLERAASDAREPLSRWLAGSPFASLDVLLRAEEPSSIEPLRRLVDAIQPSPATLGASIYRRVWTTVAHGARPRLDERWLARACRLSLLRWERKHPTCAPDARPQATVS